MAEDFSYDALYRLKTSITQGTGPMGWMGVPQEVNYTASSTFTNGNIKSKTDVGDYSYTKINAVNYVSNSSGLIPTMQQDIKYNSFLKPDAIEEGDWKQTYNYGHDYGRRLSQLYRNNMLVYERQYVEPGYEIHSEPGTGEKHILYIPGGDGICAILVKTFDDHSEHIYYPTFDHLGSIQSLADEQNNVVYEQSFDAWGRYRDVINWQLLNPYYEPDAKFKWVRGFTGHEHMPQFALINMNARLYDPVLGRMLAPDDYIQSPLYTQSYNRYSYCWNNPLRYTDPSGNVLGAMFFASAFLGEMGSNLIHGENRPFAKAYSAAQSASSEVGNLGQVSLYNNGYTSVTAGIDIFGLGLSANYSYHDGDFSANAGVGIGLMSGPSANAGISQRIHFGDEGAITLGISGSTNFKTYSIGGSAAVSYAGYSVGYGYNHFGGATGAGVGSQNTGALSIGINDFHFTEENDFLVFHGQDRWRTQALAFGTDVFSIGTNVRTNDPLNDAKDKGIENPYHSSETTGVIPSKIWGYNTSRDKFTSWKNGIIYESSGYIKYNGHGMTSIAGIHDPIFQDFIQNGLHTQHFMYKGNQNYYLNYQLPSNSNACYGGFLNSNSLYTR